MNPCFLSMIEHITLAGAIDIAALALLLIFCIAGSIRGLAGECGRFLALGAGIAVTVLLYPLLKTNIFPGSEIPWKILTIASAIVIAAIVALITNYLTKKFLRVIIGQPADSIFGAIVSVFTTAGVIVVVFFFLHSLPESSLRDILFQESITGRISEPLIRYAHRIMSSSI